jgi:voltage-gated potassium channel
VSSQGGSRRARGSLVERRARRIANARSVTLGLALTFLMLSFAGAVAIWLVDKTDFHSLGSAVWWALQTVTTVGYGDVVPTTNAGRTIGAIVMVLGVSFISFLTATVTSAVVQRGNAEKEQADIARQQQSAQEILESLESTRGTIHKLEERLDRIQARLGT